MALAIEMKRQKDKKEGWKIPITNFFFFFLHVCVDELY